NFQKYASIFSTYFQRFRRLPQTTLHRHWLSLRLSLSFQCVPLRSHCLPRVLRYCHWDNNDGLCRPLQRLGRDVYQWHFNDFLRWVIARNVLVLRPCSFLGRFELTLQFLGFLHHIGNVALAALQCVLDLSCQCDLEVTVATIVSAAKRYQPLSWQLPFDHQ